MEVFESIAIAPNIYMPGMDAWEADKNGVKYKKTQVKMRWFHAMK